jgi:hypothetical protein
MAAMKSVTPKKVYDDFTHSTKIPFLTEYQNIQPGNLCISSYLL